MSKNNNSVLNLALVASPSKPLESDENKSKHMADMDACFFHNGTGSYVYSHVTISLTYMYFTHGCDKGT